MLESGQVIRTDGNRAVVLFKRSSACGKCKACGMLKDMSEMEIDVANSLDAEPGDKVVLESKGENILKFSLIAYGIPLVMLLIGIFLGYYIFNDLFDAVDRDLLAFLSGAVFLAIGYLAIRLFEPKVRELTRDEFKMVDIITKGELQ